MKITRKLDRDILTVALEGSLDQDCSELSKKLEIFLDEDIKVLELDMEKVSYISSVGLVVLISAYKKSLKLTKKVLIINPSKQVKEVLDVVRMSRLFGLDSNMY
ncbi:MAG: STAS domain-containing protein [Candidatus Omnitrophota bacterium]